MVEVIVDGEIFRVRDEHVKKDVEYWFGLTDPEFRLASVVNGQVNDRYDAGGCGNKAFKDDWVSLPVFMRRHFDAEHVGATDEKKRQLVEKALRRGKRRRAV